ncbi:MAG TPA: hypothetical protein QF753_06985 [Victivallales bacterium]|nr:hypothetical protein [Victivallales bacterium]
MKKRNRVEGKYPFLILLICDFLTIYILFNYSYITKQQYFHLKILLSFFIALLAVYSYRKKNYGHMSFYIILIITIHPFIYLGLIMTLSWRIVIFISLLILIYMTYYNYPSKINLSFWTRR